jgi:hypothetical protein
MTYEIKGYKAFTLKYAHQGETRQQHPDQVLKRASVHSRERDYVSGALKK